MGGELEDLGTRLFLVSGPRESSPQKGLLLSYLRPYSHPPPALSGRTRDETGSGRVTTVFNISTSGV